MSEQIVLYADDPDSKIILPSRWEICSRCEGDGTHDAWGGGMTVSEMHEQGDEFAEDYAAGRYAVPCTECGGAGKVRVVDEDRATPDQLAAWEQHQADEAEHRAEIAAERRAGC